MRLLNLIKDKNSNKSKVIRNVLWALLGKFTNMFGMLFVGILVARYLGPEKYGLMNYVISFVALFSVFAGFGLSNIESVFFTVSELAVEDAAFFDCRSLS